MIEFEYGVTKLPDGLEPYNCRHDLDIDEAFAYQFKVDEDRCPHPYEFKARNDTDEVLVEVLERAVIVTVEKGDCKTADYVFRSLEYYEDGNEPIQVVKRDLGDNIYSYQLYRPNYLTNEWRVCDTCGKLMSEGFTDDDGWNHFCSEECGIKGLGKKTWDEWTDPKSGRYPEDGVGYLYYTEWYN